jgi:hypothetical protein
MNPCALRRYKHHLVLRPIARVPSSPCECTGSVCSIDQRVTGSPRLGFKSTIAAKTAFLALPKLIPPFQSPSPNPRRAQQSFLLFTYYFFHKSLFTRGAAYRGTPSPVAHSRLTHGSSSVHLRLETRGHPSALTRSFCDISQPLFRSYARRRWKGREVRVGRWFVHLSPCQ